MHLLVFGVLFPYGLAGIHKNDGDAIAGQATQTYDAMDAFPGNFCPYSSR